MSEVDQQLLRDAIDAFVARDVDRAEAVCLRDEEVDDLYLSVSSEIQAAMAHDAGFVERGVHLAAVAKFLERIGDHITNLAEHVVYLVKGKDIRHLGKRGSADVSPR